MATTPRIGRWALYAMATCVLLMVSLWFGLQCYLATNSGREMVAQQIQSRLGLPVEVQSVRLGFSSSSISISVYDPSLSREQGEILAVKSATADVSLFDLLRGHIDPKTVDLQGVTLSLRVDQDGKLITTLPKSPEGVSGTPSLPEIKLTGGRIAIHQDGRPEFSLENLQVNVDPGASGEVKLSGSIDDPNWSKWTISGNINSSAKTWRLELATDDGPLTMDRLSSIPFVPASLWTHLHADGRGAANILFTESSDQETHYAVTIKPAAASLTIPDANTTLQKVTGLIHLAGTKLELQGTRAELAGGTLAVDGSVDFGVQPTTVKLKVAAAGLDIQQLPEQWGLNTDIQGKLQGHADLTLVIQPDGRIEPRGGGSGSIEDAKVLGIPASISMRLVGDGKQYRFENPDSKPQPALPKTGTSGSRFDRKKPVPCAGQPAPKAPEHPKKEDAPDSVDATIKLRGVEISELLEKLNVKLNYKITGKVSAEVNMSVPVGRVASQAAYRFTGKISSPELHLEGLVLRDLSATAVYQDGKLTLTALTGKINQPGDLKATPGTFHGTAIVERSPPGNVSMNFSFDRIPVGELFKTIPGWSIEISGQAAGKAEFKTPYEKLSDSLAWTAFADLSAPELVVASRKITGLHVGVDVNRGAATLKNTTVTIEGIPITADAQLSLTGKFPFSAKVQTKGTNATDLRKLVPELQLPAIEGLLGIDAQVSGTASPLSFNAIGQITASKLTLAKTRANEIDLKWQVTPEKLVVSELKATVFGGTISGSADLPFASDKGGKFELGFKNVDAEAATEFVPDFPIPISGQATGKVSGTIDPAKPGQSRIGKMDVDLSAPKLTVQGFPAERLVGKASLNRGVLDYHLEGKLLGGSFEIKGSYPGPKAKAPVPVPKSERGTLKLTGLELSLIASQLAVPSLAPLRGRVDATFDYDNDLSAGNGRITVSGLAWGESVFARELTGVLLLKDGMVSLSELNGRLAGGELRARAHIRLNEKARNSFSVGVYSADAKKLFAVVPEVREKLDGPVNLTIHGQLGRGVRGSGTLSMIRGMTAGVAVADLRIPFDWSIGAGGFGRFVIREATVNTGTGKMEAKLTYEWGLGARVDGQVRFVNVPLRTIVPELGTFSLLGNGRITGRFDLNGTNLRSWNDLNGSLVATLTQTSAKEIPILQQAIPFLNPTGLVQPFQSGDIRGTLSRGVFRVERLALVNAGGQIFAEGTITMAGRIDAAVVAHTGMAGPVAGAFQLFGAVPTIGPIPVGLILDVSEFLANRTIRLNITGTVKNPVVRVNTAALLSEEAVRFFLARYVVPAGAAGALGLGLESGSFGKR